MKSALKPGPKITPSNLPELYTGNRNESEGVVVLVTNKFLTTTDLLSAIVVFSPEERRGMYPLGRVFHLNPDSWKPYFGRVILESEHANYRKE